MATEGLDITKDIVSYNDDIVTTANSYKDAIIKANSNISQLNAIKDKVSAIIKVAQARRDVHLLEILKGADYAGMTDAQAKAAYEKKYKDCFAEERIVYYDDLSIMGAPIDETNRCNDGLDNDLNGLVDSADPACKNYVPPVEPNYACILDTTESFPNTDDPNTYSSFRDDTGLNPMPDDTSYCTQRTTSDCTTSLYYSSGIGMNCRLSGN